MVEWVQRVDYAAGVSAGCGSACVRTICGRSLFGGGLTAAAEAERTIRAAHTAQPLRDPYISEAR
jgi:hypothetical protein